MDSANTIEVLLKGGSGISNLENPTTLQFHGSFSLLRHFDVRDHALMQLQLLEEWRLMRTSLCRSNPHNALDSQGLNRACSQRAAQWRAQKPIYSPPQLKLCAHKDCIA